MAGTRMPLSEAKAHAAELRTLSRTQRATAGQMFAAHDNQTVATAYGRYVEAMNELEAAGTQVEADMTSLSQARPQLTGEGYSLLRAELASEAASSTKDAATRAQQHLAELQDALVSSWQPQPADAAEARATLATLLSNVKGTEAATRLIDAASIAPEALSLLGTEHGRAAMFAAGINPGRETDRLVADVRTSLAANHPDYVTTTEALAALDGARTPLMFAANDLSQAHDDTPVDARTALRSVIGSDE